MPFGPKCLGLLDEVLWALGRNVFEQDDRRQEFKMKFLLQRVPAVDCTV
jgi:hypothetical protein